jgi:alanine-synthesizing transaminase
LRDSNTEDLNLIVSDPTKSFLLDPLILPQIPNEHQYFPDPKGYRNLRSKIVESYLLNQRNIEIENLFLTTGTSESVSFLLKGITDKDSEVLIFNIGYPIFEDILKFEKLSYEQINLIIDLKSSSEKEHLITRIDFEDLYKKINSKTRAMIIVQPNNPTGFTINEDDKKLLEEVLLKNNIFLIVDEVFSDYSLLPYYKVNEFNVPSAYLNGISKKFSLPGWKIGWFYLKNLNNSQNHLIDRLEHISDTFLSVSYPIQKAVIELFPFQKQIQSKILALVNENIKYLNEFHFYSRIQFYQPAFGWYAILFLDTGFSILNLNNFFHKEYKLNIYSGSNFGLEIKSFIVSLITDHETFKNGINLINEFFKNEAMF